MVSSSTYSLRAALTAFAVACFLSTPLLAQQTTKPEAQPPAKSGTATQQKSEFQPPKLDPLPAELAGFADEAIFVAPDKSPKLEALPDGLEKLFDEIEAPVIALEKKGGLVPSIDEPIVMAPFLVAGPGDTPAETPVIFILDDEEGHAWTDVRYSFGVSLMQVGDYRSAELQLRRVFNDRVRAHGQEHTLTRAAAFALLRLYQRWGKPEVAAKYRQRN